MKTLFVGYHDLKTEARSQEMICLLKMYGETTSVSYGAAFNDGTFVSISNKNSKKGLIEFLRNAKKAIREIRPDIIILHDTYPMVLLKYIRRLCPKAIVIQDQSELYMVNEKTDLSTLKNKVEYLLRFVEKKNTKKVDIVIAANKERAAIMKEYFELKETPLVFDNMHKIETDYNEEDCRKKFGDLFSNNRFTAIYAGGVFEDRLTYKMALQFGKLENECQLIIVGASEIGGKDKINKLIRDNNISNVHYLGFVSREELKYLMEKSDISISAFAMDIANNINCASGKVYEGLFLGKPLLAGINPSLKSLCEENQIGISTLEFGEGCKMLKQNYSFYQNNVYRFIEKLDYYHRVERLKNDIDRRLAERITNG